MIEHKTKSNSLSFTAQYNVDKLGYFEEFQSIREAIDREKQIKAGPRIKKIRMIMSTNPEWKDLSEDFVW